MSNLKKEINDNEITLANFLKKYTAIPNKFIDNHLYTSREKLKAYNLIKKTGKKYM